MMNKSDVLNLYPGHDLHLQRVLSTRRTFLRIELPIAIAEEYVPSILLYSGHFDECDCSNKLNSRLHRRCRVSCLLSDQAGTRRVIPCKS
jgi:hypothetical protein